MDISSDKQVKSHWKDLDMVKKGETESFLIAAQNNGIRSSYVKTESQIWRIKWNAVSSKQWSCWYCYMDANWTHGEKAWRQLPKNTESNIEQVLKAAPHNVAAFRTPTIHHENYQS